MKEVQMCDYGCGQEAKFITRNGKKCCSESNQKCLEIRRKNSTGVKESIKNGRMVISPACTTSGIASWNKGLTKETDFRLKNLSESLISKYRSGELYPTSRGRHHTEETKRKLSKCGGIKKGAGRGKHGWYKGYWCDSSWELAWIIYQLDHGVKFERNDIGFDYEFEGKKRKYYPDFRLTDGTYVEIKGWLNDMTKAKIDQFVAPLLVITGKLIEPYVKYVVCKYGVNFVEMYADYKKPKREIFICPICGGNSLGFGRDNICNKCSILDGRKKSHKEVPSSKTIKLEGVKKDCKERPSRETLENEICAKIPWIKLAIKYGVSDNAVRKWAREYGISWSVREYSHTPMFCSCGKKLSWRANKCRECRWKESRLGRPSKDQLKKDRYEMTFDEVGKKYGISKATAIQWCRDASEVVK